MEFDAKLLQSTIVVSSFLGFQIFGNVCESMYIGYMLKTCRGFLSMFVCLLRILNIFHFCFLWPCIIIMYQIAVETHRHVSF